MRTEVHSRYGRWTVIEPSKSDKEKSTCKCDCGTIQKVDTGSLIYGRSKACRSCSKKGNTVNKTHGLSKVRFYMVIYRGMLGRCSNPKTNGYENYGGRGIAVDERWLKFENFMSDMYESYLEHAEIFGEKDTSLDRIDVNKNYSVENCKWATRIEQHNNTRVNKFIEVDGKSDTLANWCRKYNVGYQLVQMRLYAGWEPKIALTKEKIKNA